MYEPFGNEEDSLEFKLTLNGEVLDSKMVFPIVGQALVEGAVLVYSDVWWVTSPDGFCLVKFFLGGLNLLDLFSFLLFLLLFFVDLLNLSFLFAVIFFLFLFLVIFNFLQRRLSTATHDAYINTYLFFLLGDGELNGVWDEFRVLLDDLFDLLLFKVFKLVFFEE